MASQNDSERTRAAAAITAALSAEDSGAREAPAEVRGDPKKLFCDNWDTVKMVLTFLRSQAPAFLRPIIDMVIKAGDALKKVICR